MTEYLIKRSVEKGEFPEEGLEVMTDKGRCKYYFKLGGWHTWDYIQHDFIQAKETIQFWYEPIHASKLSEANGLPSDEEINRQFIIHPIEGANKNHQDFGRQDGAKWMRSIAQQEIAKKDAVIEIVTSSRDTLSIENGELHRELAKTLIELNKAKEEITNLKEANIEYIGRRRG